MTIVQTFIDVLHLVSVCDAGMWCAGFALAALSAACFWKLVLPAGDPS